MLSPDKIVLPFADGGDKNTIPVTSQIGVVDGAPSYEDGFPPLTMIPIEEGGLPPAGQDFNGILNSLSAVARWSAAGGTYTYDAAFASSVHTGGYPFGALIRKENGTGFWICTTANTTSNPDTGGTGWQDFFTWLSVNAPGPIAYVNAPGGISSKIYLVDTSSGAFTLTLPATPSTGMAITFIDAAATWGNNNFILGRNGKTIMGQSADLIVNVSNQEFTIWYNGSDWRLV